MQKWIDLNNSYVLVSAITAVAKMTTPSFIIVVMVGQMNFNMSFDTEELRDAAFDKLKKDVGIDD